LPNIISKEQTGFIKGRCITENIRLIYDTMLCTEMNNDPGLLLLIDFEKAFDSISWVFLQNVLKLYNFGPDIQRWISCFYNNIKSCVYVNGQYSEWFEVKRGTRQGDPLSPYLFLLCVEILACMIRQNKNIKGITVFGEEVNLSQYADDTTFFLDGSEGSFNACITTLNIFADMSGLLINFDKSSAIWIGSKKKSNRIFSPEFKIQWNPETFKVLGVIFSINMQEIVRLNYENKLFEISKLLNVWSKRNLTPFGKITVIKSMALSKITHLFSSLPDPDDNFIKELNHILFKFLWDGKMDKIKRSVVCQSYETGGLKMIEINSFIASIKINWLKKILEDEGKLTRIMLGMCPLLKDIKHVGGDIKCIINSIKNPFLRDVLGHYSNMYYQNVPKNFNEFASECIFYNRFIRRDGQSIFIKNWFDNGISCVGHFLGPNGYKDYNAFRATYPTASGNFLLYNGVIRAIKRFQAELKIDFHKEYVMDIPSTWTILSKGDVKLIYSCLNVKDIKSSCIDKWTLHFQTELSKSKMFGKVIKTSKDQKLRWFQYKIIYRILSTNKLLHIQHLSDTCLCTFCGNDTETITHLFWECQHVKSYWTSFEDWLHLNFPHCRNVSLSKQLVILGTDIEIITDVILDFFILLAKYQIFLSKCKNTIPRFDMFVICIKNRYAMEKYNAAIRNNTARFMENWSMYSAFFH
jgi:hypothetical protein